MVWLLHVPLQGTYGNGMGISFEQENILHVAYRHYYDTIYSEHSKLKYDYAFLKSEHQATLVSMFNTGATVCRRICVLYVCLRHDNTV